MGQDIYTEAWKKILRSAAKKQKAGQDFRDTQPATEIAKLGDRQSTKYDGRMTAFLSKVTYNKDSAPFRDLRKAFETINDLKNAFPGKLQIELTSDEQIVIQHAFVKIEDIIEVYRKEQMPDNLNEEKYKFKRIKEFQDRWAKYEANTISFTELMDGYPFGNLISREITAPNFTQMLRHAPKEFEEAILYLYDEAIPLSERIKEYPKRFEAAFYTTPNHGKQSGQEERTLGTLLCFRYPEKYTLYKDSFYTPLCKGLGLSPKKAGEKLLHYYNEIIPQVTDSLKKQPDIIAWEQAALDDSCYKDPNILLLAQDILYTTIAYSNKQNPPDKTEEIKDNQVPQQSKLSKEVNPLLIKEALNTILYGPPGTGKTYHTVDKALQIAEPEFYKKNKDDRSKLTQRFNDLLIKDWDNTKGQIAFTTFHQSMSYEDFIEGIKPDSNDDDEIKYAVKPGIFKKLCEEASKNVESEDNFTEAYERLLEEIENNEGQLTLKTLAKGKEFIIYVNSKKNLRFHAKKEGAFAGVVTKEFVSTYLRTGKILDWPSYTKAIGEYLKQNHNYRGTTKSAHKEYVLIIDEINRGNISQIFGELITLIEEDKRADGDERLEIILPYSKAPFSVPSNLCIIGTMNTADRSVEALDTALRRRFVFEEMPPKPELLSPQKMIQHLYDRHAEVRWDNKDFRKDATALYELLGINGSFENEVKDENDEEYADYEKIYMLDLERFAGINLQVLLDTINTRLEKLLSKDHRIGHSYFIKAFSWSTLQSVFSNKIVPLLQEYFYGDYGKIQLVLGKGFVEEQRVGNEDDFFAEADYDMSSLIEKRVYTLKHFRNIEEFKSAIKKLLRIS